MSINKVIITGNLTRDASLNALPSGTPVCEFGVAVNERRKNRQTDEWEDVPVFVDCNMFGTRAEKIAQYLVKGLKVTVEGKLRYSSWEKDGQKRSKLDVVADDIEFLTARNQDQQQPQQQYQQDKYAPQQAKYAPPQNVIKAPRNVQSMVDQSLNEAKMANAVNPSLAQPAPANDAFWPEDIPF